MNQIRMWLRFVAPAVIACVIAWPASVGSGPLDDDQAVAGSPRFETVDVVIDADVPLAAYQIEVVVERGAATIVGVEGGEAPFDEPPIYDPAALSRGRIIVAAFDIAETLPAGTHRVVTLHMHSSAAPADYRVTVQAAAGADGKRIFPQAELSVRKDFH